MAGLVSKASVSRAAGALRDVTQVLCIMCIIYIYIYVYSMYHIYIYVYSMYHMYHMYSIIEHDGIVKYDII